MEFSDLLNEAKLKDIKGVVGYSKGGKLVLAESKTSFIGIGVSVDKDALNSIFGKMRKKVLAAKFGILKSYVQNIAWMTPVYTGYLVSNWRVSPTGQTSGRTSESESMGPWIRSGNLRRKMKLDPFAAAAVKQESADRMVKRIEEVESVNIGNINIRDTWTVYNFTPYAKTIDSKNGILSGAASMNVTHIAEGLKEARKIK